MMSQYNQGGGWGAQQPQQQPQLPVDPNNPDPTNYAPGLPHQVPFASPYQPQSEAEQEILGACLGLLAQGVQEAAPKNALRTTVFNLVSMNGWQSQHFAELIQFTLPVIELMVYGQGMPPQQAVAQGVDNAIQYYNAIIAQRYPTIIQYLPGGAQQEIQRLLTEAGQLQQQIQSFKSGGLQQPQQPQQSAPWGAQQPQQPQGRYPPATPQYQRQQSAPWGAQQPQQQQRSVPSGYYPQQPQGHGGQAQPRQTPSRMGMGGMAQGGMFQQQAQNQPAPSRGGVQGSALASGPVTDTLGNYAPPQPEPQRPAPTQAASTLSGMNVQRSKVDPAFQSEPFSDLDTQTNTTTTKPDTTNPERPWDRREMTNGDVYVAAHLSDWVPDNPERLAYDPTQHILFHVFSADGSIREKHVKVTKDMEYLTHEVSPSFPCKLPSYSEGEVVPLDGMFREVTELPEKPNQLSEERKKDIRESSDMLVIPKVFTANNSTDALLQAENFMGHEKLAREWDKRPVQVNYFLTYPVKDVAVDKKDEKDIKLSQYLKALFASETVNKYHERLCAIAGNAQFPRDLLHTLDEASTQSVNEGLKYGLRLELEIDSFIEDWEDLKVAILTQLGEDVGVEQINMMVASRRGDIIGGGLQLLEKEDLDEAFGVEGSLARYRSRRESLVVLATYRSETHLPVASDKLSVVVDSDDDTAQTASALTEGLLPNLHKVVKDAVRKAKDHSKHYRRTHLVTNDHRCIAVEVGMHNQQRYLLHTVERNW